MAKVTSKLQVTVPQAIADRYRIRPGDEIEWVAAGDVIHVLPPGRQPQTEDRAWQLRLFDQATQRHQERSSRRSRSRSRARDWKRERRKARKARV